MRLISISGIFSLIVSAKSTIFGKYVTWNNAQSQYRSDYDYVKIWPTWIWSQTQKVASFFDRVSDGTYNDTAILTISIDDANDNSPVFEHASYSFDVYEKSAAGKSESGVLLLNFVT